MCARMLLSSKEKDEVKSFPGKGMVLECILGEIHNLRKKQHISHVASRQQ